MLASMIAQVGSTRSTGSLSLEPYPLSPGACCWRRLVWSGSWDHSVRVWAREDLRPLSLLAFPDWVTAALPRAHHLLVQSRKERKWPGG